MGAHMFGLLLFHPWLLTGSLVLFGVQLEPGDSLNITLNAAFPKGQDRTGQKGAPTPQVPVSWVLKKDPFLSDTRNRKGSGSAHGCVCSLLLCLNCHNPLPGEERLSWWQSDCYLSLGVQTLPRLGCGGQPPPVFVAEPPPP